MRRLSLRIHQFIPYSRSNGPGSRCVIWVQGCSLGCQGCFNPQTHPSHTGSQVEIDILADQILALGSTIEGITLSGGEPFQQAKAIAGLLEYIKQNTNLTVLAFSGYSYEELQRIRWTDKIFTRLDVLIAGRYDHKQRSATGLLGSLNKKVHFFSSRYAPEDLQYIPEAEIIIPSSGEIQLTGIDPIQW